MSEELLTNVMFLVVLLTVALLILGLVLLPVFFWILKSRRSKRYQVDEKEARYRPYQRRLVLAAKANNRRPGCGITLSLTLFAAMSLIGLTLFESWDQFDWGGRLGAIFYAVLGGAVLVLMLMNFIKNFGFREFDGREVQLDDQELIVDRSLIDSRVPGEDMNHPHLQKYLHKKFYYRIPVADIEAVIVSALEHSQPPMQNRQHPFVYLALRDMDARYMIQTRFMGGTGEMRFLKHLQSISNVPLAVDERFAEFYTYLGEVPRVKLD